MPHKNPLRFPQLLVAAMSVTNFKEPNEFRIVQF